MSVHLSCQPPRIPLVRIHLDWAMHITRKDPESKWLTRDNPETNPITIKPETEQLSWVPLPCCSPSRCLFPIKSIVLSARVSPQTIHFWVLDNSPLSGPGSVVKNWHLPANAGDAGDIGSIPRSGRSSEEEVAAPSSTLARKIPVHGVTKSWTRLSANTNTHTTDIRHSESNC